MKRILLLGLLIWGIALVANAQHRNALEKPRASVNAPHPAWRYEAPTGHNAAVVRVYGPMHGGMTSVGSGVLVNYRNRIVVLTARHVLKDTRKVFIRLATGKVYEVSVLNVDGTWDCAVLIPTKTIVGITPAELEWGQEALLKHGERLTSCGYGGDDKLALNTGLMQGWSQAPGTPVGGPTDWFTISGYARQGDSGGPIFNERGRVVGVLWGTDGRTVIAVQPGRIHMVLDKAIPTERMYRQQSETGHMVPVRAPFFRTPNPTPPMQGDCPPGCNNCQNPQVQAPSIPWQAAPQAEPKVDPTASVDVAVERRLLPFRNDVNRRLDGIDRAQQQILDALNRQQAPGPLPVPPAPVPVDEAPPDKAKTLPGKIADKEAEFIAAHGGPISSRIAEKADENLGSDSAAIRFKGFTQAKVAMIVFLGGVLLVGFLIVRVLHKINDKALPKLQELAAKTPTTLDDKVVDLIARLHGKVDAVDEKIKGKIDATPELSAIRDKLAAVEAAAKNALHVGTAAALAAPAGPGAAAAAGVAAAIQGIPPATKPS